MVKSTCLALLILIGLAISGCRSVPATCNGDFKGLMPTGWNYIGQWPLDTDGKKQLDCVVLYRFDATKNGQKITPAGGVVYRQDHGRPRWIYPHRLTLPNDFYLGEGQVVPGVGNVLSGSPQPELVITDTDKSGTVVQASIFGWRDTKSDQLDADPSPDLMSYKVLGLFQGDGGVTVEKDKVTILVRRRDTRSQLADRKVYVPREDKKNYYTGDSVDLPAPTETDLISLAMGDDPTTSPYPEKTVLAFYQNIKDDGKLAGLMITGTLKVLQGGTLIYGCPPDRNQLDRVLVQEINWNPVTLDQTQVAVTLGKCKPAKAGPLQPMTPVTLQLGKVDGKWRITGIKQ